MFEGPNLWGSAMSHEPLRDAQGSAQDSQETSLGDAAVFVNLGDAALASGNYEEALASYDKAIALDPDLIAAWYNRGLTLRQLGREGEAQRSFGKAGRLRKGASLTFQRKSDPQ